MNAALVDTKGLTRDLEGKILDVRFYDGMEQRIKLEWVMIYDCHDTCNGFVYEPLSSNRLELFEKLKREHPGGFSCWGDFRDVESWKIVEEAEEQ